MAQRADDFVWGHWIALLYDSCRSGVEVRGGITNKSEAQEQARRGRAALSRVQQGQVSRAGQEFTGADLAPKTLGAMAELQGRRPQVRGLAIPLNVMEFLPEKPVELDLALFTKQRTFHQKPSHAAQEETPAGTQAHLLGLGPVVPLVSLTDREEQAMWSCSLARREPLTCRGQFASLDAHFRLSLHCEPQAILAQAILAQAVFSRTAHCSRVCCGFEVLFFSPLLHPVSVAHFMVRKGWQSMDVPSGWIQVLRGPPEVRAVAIG